MEFLTLLKAIILGMVEGLTEFAPVSSTGHMVIVDDMWLQSEEFLTKYVANTFKVVIQLGSILAVVIIFWNRFMDLLGLHRLKRVSKSSANNVHSNTSNSGDFGSSSSNPNRSNTSTSSSINSGSNHTGSNSLSSSDSSSATGRLKLSQVIVGLLPAGILGILTEDLIDEHLFATWVVLIGLVVGALLMIAADLFRPKEPKVNSVDQITYKQAFGIGLFQCFSIWPGFSRSGSTISGGVLLGLSHRAASDFTFIMAVPIMAGASTISLVKNWEYFSLDALPFFIVGFISAFLFAVVCIRFFLKLINRVKLIPFAIYRILLAIVIYVVYF